MDPIALTTIIHHGSPMFGSAPTREPGVPGLQDWPTRGAAVNITFFPNAKDMGIAEYAFMAGCLVAASAHCRDRSGIAQEGRIFVAGVAQGDRGRVQPLG
jgi:hypothetical protein